MFNLSFCNEELYKERLKFGLGGIPNFDDKESLKYYHIRTSFIKTQSMFEYDGLPENDIEDTPLQYIKRETLEQQIQMGGFTCFFEYKGKYYTSFGGLGGKPDVNFMPTTCTVANPYLNFSKTLEINKDCVIIPNDRFYMGLYPLNTYFASQLCENDLSLNALLISARALNILVATDDDEKSSLDKVIEDLKKGKISSALSKNILTNGIKSLPFGSSASNQTLIQLLEHRQYTKGSWLNELGVQSNYNMKRETITSSENILNVDGLLPLADNMLYMREKAFERIKHLFGVNITPHFSSSWLKMRKEIKLKEEINENEANKKVQSSEQENEVNEEVQSSEQENKEDKENGNKD